MEFAEYMLSKFNGIGYALLTTLLFFILPISVVALGYYCIKKRENDNRSTVFAKVAVVIAELIALIPLIGIIFFSEDGILYLVLLPINIIGTMVFLLPVVLPIICVVLTRKRRKQNKSIVPTITCYSIATILFLVLSICWIMKDF